MFLATDDFADIKSSKIKKQIEQSLEGFKMYKPGDYVKGTIIAKTEDSILVDVGSRAEGLVQGRELKTDLMDVNKLKPGDEILVYVLSGEGRDGTIVLSLRKAEIIKVWLDVEEAFKKQEVVTVKVVEVNTGGVICELPSGLRGFIPVSQLDPRRVFGEGGKAKHKNVQSEVHKRLSQLLGEEIQVKIYEVDREKGKIIFSEKAMILGEDLASRKELLKKIKPGDILEGVITGITPFGIFVNASGLEGLVHLSELSWDKVTDVASKFKVGEKIKVMVLSIDDAGRRVAYSVKRLTPDPWQEKIKKYKVGDVVEGTIDGLVDFGAFVRIEEGINGLIHISEVAEGRIKHPKEVLKVGQKVKVAILGISTTSRHLSLSLKRVDQKTGEIKPGFEIGKKLSKGKRKDKKQANVEIAGASTDADQKGKEKEEKDEPKASKSSKK